MRRLLAVAIVASAACGAEDGEPLSGDIAFSIDGEEILPTTGAAIRDSDMDKELVVIGTRDVSCNTSLGTPLRKGTYITIQVDRAASLGTPLTAVTASFVRVESSGTLIDGVMDAMLTLDAIDSRVAGTVTFQKAAQDGPIVEASGSFEVLNCSPP